MNRTQFYTTHWQERLGNMENIWHKFIQPCVIFLAFVTNLLPLFIFRRPRFNCISIGFYLKVLCCQNLLFLTVVYLPSWIATISNLDDIENLTDVGCRIYKFVCSVFQYTGPWIVVAMTVDRYIAIWHPASAPDRTTVFMAKIATAIIYVAMVWLSVHVMWFSNLEKQGCFTDISLLEVRIWSYISAFANGCLPLVVLLCFSGMITTGVIVKGTAHTSNTGRPSADLTYSVLILAVLYVLFVTPVTIIGYIYMFLTPDRIQSDKYAFFIHLFDHVSFGHQLLTFFVLLFCSRSFREESKEIFLQLKKNLCGPRTNDSSVKLLRRNSTCIVEIENGREIATAVV
ncbi:somatostatin receptor type 5-like [Saccostrea cucullata]|uniref:somatostatin receptor type 5-like n=1 Tax=Saccostrea cuccullata TaxID=36930 RepID=UPI002ED4310A